MRNKTTYLTILLAAFLLSSCQDGIDVVIKDLGAELGLRAAASAPTKGYVTGTSLEDTPYDALYAADPSRTARAITLTSWLVPQEGTPQEYLRDEVFALGGDGLWHRDPAAYWPVGSTMDFVALSSTLPFGADAVWHDPADPVGRTTVAVGPAFTQDDILFSVALGRTAPPNGGTVDMVFDHAQAWLTFNVRATEEDVVTLHRIEVLDAYTGGVLTVTHPYGTATGEWSFRGEERRATAVDDVFDAYGRKVPSSPRHLDWLLPEQLQKDIAIYYSLEGSDMEMRYVYPLEASGETWLMGRHYIYDITFTPRSIEFIPTVTDWETVVPAPSVDREVSGTGEGVPDHVGAEFTFSAVDTYLWRPDAESAYTELTQGVGAWGEAVTWNCGEWAVTLRAVADGYEWSCERDYREEPLTLGIRTPGRVEYVMTASSNYRGTPLKYSVNGGPWQTLALGSGIAVAAGDKVRLLGYGYYVDSYDSNTGEPLRGYHIRASGGCTMDAWGNAASMSLSNEEYNAVEFVSYDAPVNLDGLFYGNTGLIDASGIVLNAPKSVRYTISGYMHLDALYGYAYMFAGCTALEAAPPSLPADLSNGGNVSEGTGASAAEGMFKGCISLRTAPALPAAEVPASCYESMFEGCIGLRAAPDLPATKLGRRSYAAMFKGCTALRKCPALPSGFVPGSAYEAMFKGCTALTTTCRLDAEDLYGSCYKSMFEGCTGLVSTTDVLPATAVPGSAYQAMFKNCTSLRAAPDIRLDDRAEYYVMMEMFYGCTSLATGPAAIRATSFDQSAMAYAFYNCRSLTSGPSLTVATAAASEYFGSQFHRTFMGCRSMREIDFAYNYDTVGICALKETFSGCTALVSVPVLGFSTVCDNGCYRTFYNCSSLPDIPAMRVTALEQRIESSSYSQEYARNMQEMFYYCSSATDGTGVFLTEDTVPYCGYYQMFTGCQSLTALGGMAAITVGEQGCYSMFYNCPSLAAVPPGLSIGNVARFGCYNMFVSCISLADVPPFTTTSVGDNGMASMFSNCQNITETPDLSSVTTLGNSAMASMFNNCFSLVRATLPTAATIPTSACQSMFMNCSSLVDVPAELPATTVGSQGCQQMFYGCSSLIDAPSMCSTSLGGSACREMFRNCTALVRGPRRLPAATVASMSCYMMFIGCPAMEEGPEALPATALDNNCYYQMFRNCSSLKAAPAMAPSSVGNYSCYEMFRGCSSMTEGPAGFGVTSLSGTYCCSGMFNGCTLMNDFGFTCTVSTATQHCFSSMFQGCASLTQAPALPATELAANCYYYMFQGCTSLTQAPELPATTAAPNCYSNMFAGCTSLAQAPALPATELAANCYYYMFQGCTSLTQAPPELPATTLASSCYYQMFSGCSALSAGPDLPAPTLASSCYYRMFYGCNRLKRIKALFTTVPSSSYLSEWLYQVGSYGTFVKSSAATWSDSVAGIPSGWTVTVE